MVTKTDKLSNLEAADEKDASEFIAGITRDIGAEFRETVGSLQLFQIAALPQSDSELKLGHGVVALFERWLETQGPASIRPPLPDSTTSEREFDRFMTRTRPVSQ